MTLSKFVSRRAESHWADVCISGCRSPVASGCEVFDDPVLGGVTIPSVSSDLMGVNDIWSTPIVARVGELWVPARGLEAAL